VGRIGVYALLCLIGGTIGGLSTKLFDGKSLGTLQVNSLEILDTHRMVRAILSAQDDGSVSLRLLSRKGSPVIILAAGPISGRDQMQAQYGKLSIQNGDGRPTVQLNTNASGQGSLTFSSARVGDQVTVGYSRYGDFEDAHERGAWGVQIAGPEHSKKGINVFSLDGVLQGTTIPVEPPTSTHH